MRTIFTSIKIADLLQSLKDGGQVFICHHICWMVRHKFEEIPEFQEFRREKTCHPHRIPFDFYAQQQTILHKQFGDDVPDLTMQLFEYLNSWITELFDSNIEILKTSFSSEAEHALFALKESNSVPYSAAWEREFRTNLLESILEDNPNATLNIHIYL